MRASRAQSGALGAPRSVRGGSGRSPVEVTMARNGKKFRAAAEQIEDRYYSLDEAIPLVQRVRFAGFDESVELALRLGVNPKHADQMVRIFLRIYPTSPSTGRMNGSARPIGYPLPSSS